MIGKWVQVKPISEETLASYGLPLDLSGQVGQVVTEMHVDYLKISFPRYTVALPKTFVVDVAKPGNVSEAFRVAMAKMTKEMSWTLRTFGIEMTPDEIEQIAREEIVLAWREQLREMYKDMMKQ